MGQVKVSARGIKISNKETHHAFGNYILLKLMQSFRIQNVDSDTFHYASPLCYLRAVLADFCRCSTSAVHSHWLGVVCQFRLSGTPRAQRKS